MDGLSKEDFKWVIQNRCNIYAQEWYHRLGPISKQHLDHIFDSLEDYIEKEIYEVLEFHERVEYERGLEECEDND